MGVLHTVRSPNRCGFISALCGAWLALCSPCAPASTPVPTSASFTVSAVVSSGCWLVGQPGQTSGIGFGLLDFGSHPALRSGTQLAAVSFGAGSPAQLQCTPGVAATMTIDGGQNALGPQRRMRFGTFYLPYTLTTQPGGGTPIAPGVGIAVDATGGPTLLPIYGSLSMPGSGLPAGRYTDTVQIVFSW